MKMLSSNRHRGLFASVDGPSAAGKSTIVEHLAQLLVASGEDGRAEVAFYREARERLIRGGFNVMVVDVNCQPPEQIAALICERLMTLLAIRRK
jgi:cytidylate kinase